MTVAADLDRIQAKLQDGGKIWPRAELLRWWNDGYRQLLAESQGARRIRALDMPGRHTFALTYEWEDRHAPGTVRKPSRTLAAGSLQGTGLWEVEAVAGVTPTDALEGYTYEWERAYTGATDRHYRFAFPKNHERIVRLAWEDRRLFPVSVRELDEADIGWMGRVGMPQWWTTGTGRVRSVEVFEIVTDDQQAYALVNGPHGLPRSWSGSRTWGVDAVEPPWTVYAVTTSGDEDALITPGGRHVPQSAGTFAWEISGNYAEEPGFVWTIDFTAVQPGVTEAAPTSTIVDTDPVLSTTGNIAAAVVHPWEYNPFAGGPWLDVDAASPGQRGIWPWERLDPAGAYESLAQAGGVAPVVLGLGLRMTTESATAGRFVTQTWESEVLASATTFTTGVVRGCYPWEHAHGAARITVPLGGVRGVSSPDRQYLAVPSDAQPLDHGGRAVDWKSSTDSLLVTEVVLPDEPMTERDTPNLIPPPMQKYVRYFVLARAYGRQGEGRSAILADHYGRRYQHGVTFFRSLAQLATRDRVYQRQEAAPVQRRTPRVQLPSTFERVW